MTKNLNKKVENTTDVSNRLREILLEQTRLKKLVETLSGGTGLQAGDNISDLVNDSGYITSDDLPVVAYKVYTAKLTQTGTSAPTATVEENTLGGTVTWTRQSAGQYAFGLPISAANTKIFIFISSSTSGDYDATMINASSNTDSGVLFTYGFVFGLSMTSKVDEILNDTAIEIRVYE